MGDAVVVVILLGLGALSALVALMPHQLHGSLESSMRKGQERMRATGERNRYFGPGTDFEKFLRQLRLMAALAAALSLGMAGLVLWG